MSKLEKLKRSKEQKQKEYDHSIATMRSKYDMLWDKGVFIKKMAALLDLSEDSIRNHHLSTIWKVPVKYHRAYHVNLDRILKEQEDKI